MKQTQKVLFHLQAMEEQKEEIVGFLHNVSPTKKSSKTSYFDMSIQTTDGLVRGVCFSGSKQEHFDQMSKKKSPIKLQNFRIERAGDATTVLMNNNVLLEPTKEIPFSRIELPSANNIQSISAANTNQSITIKAKLIQMSSTKKSEDRGWMIQQCYVQLLVQIKESKITVTLFNDILHDMLASQGKSTLPITEETITAFLLELPTITSITFNNKTKIVESVQI